MDNVKVFQAWDDKIDQWKVKQSFMSFCFANTVSLDLNLSVNIQSLYVVTIDR